MQLADLIRDRRVLSYGGLALVLVVALGCLSGLWINQQFGTYTLKRQQEERNELARLISQQYHGATGWDGPALGSLGIQALDRGMVIKVTSAQGVTLWDAQLYNDWLCQQVIAHHADLTGSDGAYRVEPYPLISDSALVGNLDVGYYGPYYFGQNEADFLKILHLKLVLTASAILCFTWMLLWFLFPGEKSREEESPWYHR